MTTVVKTVYKVYQIRCGSLLSGALQMLNLVEGLTFKTEYGCSNT